MSHLSASLIIKKTLNGGMYMLSLILTFTIIFFIGMIVGYIVSHVGYRFQSPFRSPITQRPNKIKTYK